MTSQYNLFEHLQRDGNGITSLPNGLRYLESFITTGEQDALVAYIRELPFREFEFHGYTGKRRVVSFGWQYDYSGRQLRRAAEIPEFLLNLRLRAASFAHLDQQSLQQALVTEYSPGAGIGWHRDKALFGQVVGVSLLATCILRFRRKAGERWERANLAAEPCSAYLLSGEARTLWEHSISSVESLRYSITFREVRD